MRVEVLTTLYPGPSRPYEGVFAERRWLGMAARGHEVAVLQPLPRTPGPFRPRWRELAALPRHETRGGIEITRPRYLHLPGRARYNARAFARTGLRALARRPRPDVVVADYAWPAAAIAPALAERGLPCVVSGRGSDVLQVAGEAGLGDELARYLVAAGHWCAVSQDLVDAMDRLAGAPGRGHLVPNGVDLDVFRPRERAACRRELGLPEAGRVVLVCGHLIERKDPLLALDVFARAAGPEDRLVFLGRGPLEGRLIERIAERALEAHVTLAGEVPPGALAAWYGAADALLLTSRREGRPNVVLEALASGRPVLATDAGGTSELLAAGAHRMLATTRDADELGFRLRALLDDPPAADELRASVAHLSWDASLDALERCLAEAAAA